MYYLCRFRIYNKKVDGCKNNHEKLSTTKVGENIPSGFLMSMISSFKYIEKKHDICRDEDYMKKFCEYLKQHTTRMTNLKKMKINLLRNEQHKSY